MTRALALLIVALLAAGSLVNGGGSITVADAPATAVDSELPELGPNVLIMSEYIRSAAVTGTENTGLGSCSFSPGTFSTQNFNSLPAGTTFVSVDQGNIASTSSGVIQLADVPAPCPTSFTLTGSLSNNDTYVINFTVT